MAGVMGMWRGNKKEVIRISLVCLAYIVIMTGVFIYYREMTNLVSIGFMSVVLLISAAATVAFCGVIYSGQRERIASLYEKLGEFGDTVLFEYLFRDGSIHLSPNAAGQVELPVIELRLKRYTKTPPSEGEKSTFEFRMRSSDETYHWCVCSLITEYDKRKQPVRLIGKLDDISEQKRREEKLLVQSSRDGLSRVYNKTAFEYMAGETLRDGSCGYLYMIDIDNFKEVNDQFGHLAGDRILIKIGELLRDIFRDSDLIGRVGGDEFVVYSEETRDGAMSRAERLLKAVADFMPEEGRNISVSIGIALSSGKEGYSELFSHADHAMYQAKQEGKNRIAYYNEGE